ncbi:MAG: glycerate kinase, partial [Lachnospiraceae bacterium]|nr:glycerate kinase [Lachnospiraceae bacterium]
MRVVVAMDSFKGSISSLEAGDAVENGIHRVNRDTEVVVLPVADGGEGTTEALTYGMKGIMREVSVTGPLGQAVTAQYGIINCDTAVMEMSAAAGLSLLDRNSRNPLDATTYGLGEMITDSIKQGCRHFIIGIGGSATNDGGAGMLQALGFRLKDSAGNDIRPGARGLKDLRQIDTASVIEELKDCQFYVACDVTNPLCGKNGASMVFG